MSPPSLCIQCAGPASPSTQHETRRTWQKRRIPESRAPRLSTPPAPHGLKFPRPVRPGGRPAALCQWRPGWPPERTTAPRPRTCPFHGAPPVSPAFQSWHRPQPFFASLGTLYLSQSDPPEGQHRGALMSVGQVGPGGWRATGLYAPLASVSQRARDGCTLLVRGAVSTVSGVDVQQLGGSQSGIPNLFREWSAAACAAVPRRPPYSPALASWRLTWP